MRHRVGAYRLIALNRGLSYLVWVVYTTIAGLFAYEILGLGPLPFNLIG